MIPGETVKDGVIFVYFREARTTVAQAFRNMRWVPFKTSTANRSRTYDYRSRDRLIYDGVDREAATPRYIITATASEVTTLMDEIERLVATQGYEGNGIATYHG